MIDRIVAWIDSRTGAVNAGNAFLTEAIPKSVGWRNTLGSVAGALLLVQILTGFLLALYYAPHPDGAYQSVQYIEDEVNGGGLVRALHFWGASFVVVALFLHMCRTFYAGAYKSPRELNWLLGLALFGVVIGLAFTGQLLPWNQEGYWAANVGIEIAASAPIVGGAIRKLLTGGDSVGALTLTRFYAMHVVLLPLLLGLLTVGHILLLRRHGPQRPDSDRSKDTVPFHPNQSFRDIVVTSVAFAGLVAVAWHYGGPDRGPIDPKDTAYIPRPEWYLLAHYQLLRITPGSLKVVATFVIPTLLLAAMVLLPWIDRSPGSAIRKRKRVVAAGSVVILGVTGFTVWGIVAAPETSEAEGAVTEGTETGDPTAAGRRIYQQNKCMDCHKINRRGRDIGPDLTYVGDRLQRDYLRAWLEDPQAFNPDTPMPKTEATPEELDILTDYLMSLKRDGAS